MTFSDFRAIRASAGKLIAALTLSAALTLAGCGGSPGSIDVAGTRVVSADRSFAMQSVNALRAESGLGPLAYSGRLDEAALRQARAMAAESEMSHDVEGALSARVAVYGYDWGAVAENIAWGYQDTPSAMTGWKRSPGHRVNILNPRVTEMGFGAAIGSNGAPYWAMIFGTERQQMR